MERNAVGIWGKNKNRENEGNTRSINQTFGQAESRTEEKIFVFFKAFSSAHEKLLIEMLIE